MRGYNTKLSGYVKNYKFNSIFIKNLAALMILIIIPLISIIVISYYYYSNIQRSEIKSYNQIYVTKVANSVDNIIKESKNQINYIAYNFEVELFMYSTGKEDTPNFKFQIIHDMISMPIISKGYINSIYVYADNSNNVISPRGMFPYDNFYDKKCLEPYRSQKSKVTENWMAITENESAMSSERQLSIYCNIKYGSKNCGVVVINLNLKALEEQLGILQNEEVYLTYKGEILFSRKSEQIGQDARLVESYYTMVQGKDKAFRGKSAEIKISEDTGVKCVSFFSSDIYEGRLKNIREFLIIFVVLMVVVTLVLCLYISIKIFNPITTIISAIEENKDMLFGNKNILTEKNEIKYIVSSIQKTADKNKNIEEELSKRIILLKKAQTIALQSQINPHFIHNTLETINWMAVGILGRDNNISVITTALSKMLRLALENTDTIIPFSDELNNAKMYIEIQQKRYVDKFDIIYNIQEEIMNCKTVKIILQPIIENAIYHGIKPLTNKGEIIVQGELIEKVVYISIMDNGLGMTEEEIERLNLSISSNFIKESLHIGISNVNQRLKLYFGESYGLHIESDYSFGTKVIIKFPFLE
jgi:two-component system, sensor histidine kinase YesM